MDQNQVNKKNLLLRLIALGLLLVAISIGITALFLPIGLDESTIVNIITIIGAGITQGLSYFLALTLIIFLCMAAIPVLLSFISILKKNNIAFYIAIVFLIMFSLIGIVFIVFNRDYVNLWFYAFYISIVVLCIADFVILMIAKRFQDKLDYELEGLGEDGLISEEDYEGKEEEIEEKKRFFEPRNEKKAKGKVTAILVINIISLLFLFTILFTPPYFFNYTEGMASIFSNALGFVLFRTEFSLINTVLFLSFFCLILLCVFNFIISISAYFSNKELFVKESKTIIICNFMVSLVFLFVGFGIQLYYALTQGIKIMTFAYIPVALSTITTILYSIFKGQFDRANNTIVVEKGGPKAPCYLRAEPLIYVLLVTAVTICSIFLVYIRVSYETDSVGTSSTFTGLDLLLNYSGLGAAYQLLAFFVIAMLITSGIGLIFTICTYFVRYKNFENVAKVVAYSNMLFIFLFGMSGFYFKVAQQINEENIKALLNYYQITLPSGSSYSISTDTIYALVVDVVIGAFIFLRRAFDRPINYDLAIKGDGVDTGEVSSAEHKDTGVNDTGAIMNQTDGTCLGQGKGEIEDNLPSNFDPCPAFSEIDNKIPLFTEDLNKRMELVQKEYSLDDLCTFVVEYAKNSRLHLSYTKKDVATFVAGLGAARLTILQGMSGTGKTSLPKIFTEAISANCEIIEVESSWKDKNELLGYYNEFSSIYTPKKFTQALYRATLNPTIPTFIVLDEMNLSRIEYYFSDFLSLMENEEDKRFIKLLNIELSNKVDGAGHPYASLIDGHTIKVSPNIWFIGTANRDESTFVISDKVYDRAHTMNFNKRAPKVHDFKDPLEKRFYTYNSIAEMFNKALTTQKFEAESNRLIKGVEQLLAPYNISFGNRILNQIEAFVKIYKECFPKENVEDEAVETILLSKVVSKLEVKTIEDKGSLIQAFSDLSLMKCVEFIEKLNED